MRECEQCGANIEHRRADATYCSPYCSLRAFRSKRGTPRIAKCGICERPFVPTTSRHAYCTSACSLTADRRRREALNSGAGKGHAAGQEFVPRRICEGCGERFYAPPVLVRRGGGRFCGNACRTRDLALHPERYPQTQGRRGRGGRREDLGGRYFRSSWEANYARYLDWLEARGEIAGWLYEPQTFEFHAIKKGSRFYTPDFKVIAHDGTHQWHEVKGYMDPRSATKLKRMRRYYPSEGIVLIERAQYKAIAAAVSSLLPGWESRRPGEA